jgi:chromosome segregation ATPase
MQERIEELRNEFNSLKKEEDELCVTYHRECLMPCEDEIDSEEIKLRALQDKLDNQSNVNEPDHATVIKLRADIEQIKQRIKSLDSQEIDIWTHNYHPKTRRIELRMDEIRYEIHLMKCLAV